MIGRAAAAAGAMFASFAALGCGSIVPPGTYETPLLGFKAVVADTSETFDLSHTSIGIVWVDPLALRDEIPQPPQDIKVTGPSDRTYQVGLFAPPPEEAIRRLPDPSTGELAVSFAFGEIVLFDDGDGDGTFAISPLANGSLMFGPDAYRGMSDRRVVIYVEQPARPGALDGNVWKTLSEGPGYRLADILCPAVVTLAPLDRFTNMTFESTPSAELPITRPCLAPTRPAAGAQP